MALKEPVKVLETLTQLVGLWLSITRLPLTVGDTEMRAEALVRGEEVRVRLSTAVREGEPEMEGEALME